MSDSTGKYIYRNKKTGELVQSNINLDLDIYEFVYELKNSMMSANDIRIK